METRMTEDPYKPKTELGKLLLVLIEEVAGHSPGAFREIHLNNALKQADDGFVTL
jgi:hypothetical protein